MAVLDLVFGRPLSSAEAKDERVGSFAGVSVFGLDALSSVAYGPEAALTILMPLGVAGLGYILPITVAVSSILAIVYFSYRQTISAYPSGAGTYSVAKENLGRHFGLLGAVALLIDYTLNVAVGISAGIGALVSAIHSLQPYTTALCLAVLAVLTFVNLRGVRESGFAFVPPTYMFVGCLGIITAIGIYKTLSAGGHPQSVAPLPAPAAIKEQISWWIILKAFATGRDGCALAQMRL
jgi:amino acid transporter